MNREIKAEPPSQAPSIAQVRYTEALLDRLFSQAEQNLDFPMAKWVYETMGEADRTQTESRLKIVEAEFKRETRALEERYREARQSVQQALKSLRSQPLNKSLPALNAAKTQLQETIASLQAWLIQVREASWERKLKDLNALLADLNDHQQALQAAQQAIRETRLGLVSHLWPLVMPGTPPGLTMPPPELPLQPSDLPIERQRHVLEELWMTIDELINAFPEDAETITWRDWKVSIQKTWLESKLMISRGKPTWMDRLTPRSED